MANHFKLRTYQQVLLCSSCYYLSGRFFWKGYRLGRFAGAGAIKGDHQVRLGMKVTLRLDHLGR